jgi:energy-coupling factor transporter ATP-binding protein EcfA2
MVIGQNPFRERSRITNPDRFVGRWSELSLIFDRLEAGRPVLIIGQHGVGKSSLLTHIQQSGAATMELPTLRSYFIDLALLPDATACYQLVCQALNQRGTSNAELEQAIAESGAPLLLCLDNAEQALAAGWGEVLLEQLARSTRHTDLFLAVVAGGRAPDLSERFAIVSVGAFANVEVGLLADAYLDQTGVQFTPAEQRELAMISVGHPAYLQRAAYHLFNSKTGGPTHWQQAYFDEARSTPVPGAPLPAAVFAGELGQRSESVYGNEPGRSPIGGQPPLQLDTGASLRILVPFGVAAMVGVISGNWWLAVLLGVVLLVVAARKR